MDFAAFLEKYSGMFGQATVNTLMLSVVTVAIAVFTGTAVCLMKISKVKILKAVATAYVEFIRGTPLLVQIFIVYYGLPALGINFPTFSLFGMTFDRFFSGALALMLNSTAYVCEIVRSGIQSIDSGQDEAARSIGFNKRQSMMYVVFPQAFKNILPALGNEFVSIIKESSQVSVIGVAELMYVTNTVRAISFQTVMPLVVVSIIYFIITFAFSSLIRVLEKRMSVSNRK